MFSTARLSFFLGDCPKAVGAWCCGDYLPIPQPSQPGPGRKLGTAAVPPFYLRWLVNSERLDSMSRCHVKSNPPCCLWRTVMPPDSVTDQSLIKRYLKMADTLPVVTT